MKSKKKKQDRFVLLRLYVAGESPSSLKAISNLNAIAEEYLSDNHKIEIVDTLAGMSVAFGDGVLVTPTLVKVSTEPTRHIIGDLSDKQKVLQVLGDLKKKSKSDKESSDNRIFKKSRGFRRK